MMRFAALLFIALLFCPAAVSAQTFGAQSFTLDNGMQVVVIPNHRAPVVAHMMWYKVGAADEKPGLSGMAHYFEHLMFKGTDTLEPGEFSRIVKTLGGEDNAFTGQDYTAYFQIISKEHLEKVMEMEADRMVNLAPPADHYASEKKVVLEERRQRTENDPRGLFSEQLRSALFVNHPYGTPVIGWMSEIKDYQWEDVKKFYDKWYAPNNAVLVVSGDITAEELKPRAQRIYGQIPVKDIPERARPAVPPAIGTTHLELQDPSIHQPVLQIMLIAPNYADQKEDALALEVLQDILSGGPTTRLYKNLVVDEKLATSVSLYYSSGAFDYGTIGISATPAPGIDLMELEQAVFEQLRDVIKNGVSEEEVRDAIQRLQDDAVYARDSVKGPAMIFGQALSTGSSVQDVENWPEEIAKVTPEQVQAAAEKYLNPDAAWIRPPVIGYMKPAAPQENTAADMDKGEDKEEAQ